MGHEGPLQVPRQGRLGATERLNTTRGLEKIALGIIAKRQLIAPQGLDQGGLGGRRQGRHGGGDGAPIGGEPLYVALQFDKLTTKVVEARLWRSTHGNL